MLGLLDFLGARVEPARFQAGAVVRHKRYRYKGVVIASDPRCQAGQQWYGKRRNRPDRNQPWYHLLVEGSGGLSDYVAQSDLLEEEVEVRGELHQDTAPIALGKDSCPAAR